MAIIIYIIITGQRNNTQGRRHLLPSSFTPSSSGSSSVDEQNYPSVSVSHDEQISNREKQLQRQLDTTRRELEKERARLWSYKTEVELTLTDIGKEVCEYKNQLVLLASAMEREYNNWKTVQARLEAQIEQERLKVRSRDVLIHELKLSKEQESAALSNQLSIIRHQLETENNDLSHQLQPALSDSKVSCQHHMA